MTLKSLAKLVRAQVRMATLAFPKRVECNACGWRGRCFLNDDWQCNVCCPRCGSSVRHRLLCAAHSPDGPFPAESIYRGKSVLHVAPEPILSRMIEPLAQKYVRADYFHDDVDIQLDITDMKDIASATYDVLIACDVLEHVEDFRRALREIHRVLSPGGWTILTVPQDDGRATTYEDRSLTTEAQRLEAFGQHDHLRMFGDDFAQEVARHCFEVHIVDQRSFSKQMAAWHRFAPAPSPRPLATNHRRVYFCHHRKNTGEVHEKVASR